MRWELSWRADPRAAALADRHYNRQKVGAKQFVPPGRCLVLVDHRVGQSATAFWVTSWPLAQYVRHEWAGAWVCSAFRREPGCVHRASDLILDAVAATRWRWPRVPELGMVTFVDEGKTLGERRRGVGRVVGACFLRAGFEHVGFTKEENLHAFLLRPERMPPAAPPFGAQGDFFAP